MLEMYDIDTLWVPKEVLQSMHISRDALVEGVTLIAYQDVPGLLQQHAKILNF
jgi:tRNA 2-thiouridine synthesizing protein C